MRNSLQLLILEGSDSDAKLAVSALERASYSCAWVRVQTRTELVEQLDRQRYDLILANIRMPKLDGLAALQLVRQRGIDTPFIMCAARIGTDALSDIFRAGATDYLSKARLDRLPSIVDRALEEHDAKRRRWQSVKSLRQSEQRCAAFMRNLPKAACIKDPEVRHVSAPGQHFAHVPPPDGLGSSDHQPRQPAPTAARWYGVAHQHSDLAGGEAGKGQPAPRTAAAHSLLNLDFPIPAGNGVPAMTGGTAVDMPQTLRRETEAEALLEVVTTIQGSSDLAEVLDQVHRLLLPLLPCDRVHTVGWNPSAGAFELLAVNELAGHRRGDPDDALDLPLELVESWTRLASPKAKRNGTPAPRAMGAKLERFGDTTFLSAPLNLRGIIAGVMVAARDGDGEPFEAHAIHLFERVVQQAAAAMATIDSHSSRGEEAHLNAAMAEIGYELIAAGNSPDLLDRLCRVTTRVMSCSRSYTALWEPHEEAFMPVASHGYTVEEQEILRTLKLPRAELADRLGRLEQRIVLPVAPVEAGALGPAHPARTSLWMALRRGREVEGIHIASFDGPEDGLSPHHERLGRELATLASLAIENIRLVEDLKAANRLKSDFVATMSHELRSPLNSILGYADLLSDSAFGPVTSEQVRILQSVSKNGQRLLNLINATLDVSRIDAGHLPLEVAPVAMPDLIAEIEVDIGEAQEESGLTFVWDVAKDLPSFETDRVKLKVVLMNLINNAIKFTPHGTVTVTAAARRQGVEIGVADTGIGMTPDVVSIIFEPFRQGDSSSTRRFGGVGLGLYLARRLLNLLSGTIDVESRADCGSTFRVWIPLTIASRQGRKLAAFA